jgi:hypothetical protein
MTVRLKTSWKYHVKCRYLSNPSHLENYHKKIENINPHKAPGYDLITGKILGQLPRKALVLLTTICNSMLRMS